ncbi:MAG: hypothetical protein HON94_07340 [Methylococcales bacterium]|nr:hypothetical protein [Methylococcales bacterium]
MTLEELLQISMDQVPNDESFIESLLQQVQAKLDAIDSFDPSTEPLEKKLLKLKFQLIYKIDHPWRF